MGSKGYIPGLDGLRALAIILVMTFHAGLNDFGWMGVQLFFVLSGFLITGILWSERQRPGGTGEKLGRFWYRRSLRIFPLYFTYLLVWVVSWILFRFPAYLPDNLPYLVSYTFNYTRNSSFWMGNPLFTHLWSLSVEEQFYLFFPLLMLLAPVRWVRVALPLVIIAGPALRWGLGHWYTGGGMTAEAASDAVYWNTLSHLDAFFMGGAIHIFSLQQRVRRPHILLLVSLTLVVAAGAFNVGAGAGAGSALLHLGYPHTAPGAVQHIWQYTLLNLFFSALILTLISGAPVRPVATLLRLLEGRWLVRIGQVSYGMYLFHWALLVYVYARWVPGPGNWGLIWFLPYLALVYGVAELSFRLYERRFLKWKDRFFKGPVPQRAGVGPAEPAA